MRKNQQLRDKLRLIQDLPSAAQGASYLRCQLPLCLLCDLAPVLVRVSMPAQHHDQEASQGGKGLFSLHFCIAVHHKRKSGLELKQIRKQELMQKPWRDVTYWLVSSGLLSLLSYRTQNYQPRDGTTHNGPSLFDHQLRKCLTAGAHGGISSSESLSV